MTVKGDEDKEKSWWNRRSGGTKAFIFIGGIFGIFILSMLLMLVNMAYQLGDDVKHANITIPANNSNVSTVVNNSVSDNSSSSSSTTSSSNPGEDYDRGYDSGYYDGVMDAYDGEPKNPNVAKSLKVADIWREGYKEGYNQGYSDIKNGRSLQRPQLSWNAYMDPRTGETIQ